MTERGHLAAGARSRPDLDFAPAVVVHLGSVLGPGSERLRDVRDVAPGIQTLLNLLQDVGQKTDRPQPKELAARPCGEFLQAVGEHDAVGAGRIRHVDADRKDEQIGRTGDHVEHGLVGIGRQL